MWFDKVDTFHLFEYLGFGGVELKIPFSRRTMRGCCPTGWPPAEGRVIDNADLYKFKVEYDFPSECSWARKLAISNTDGANWSIFQLLHQLTQHFQANSYCFSVPCLQEFEMSLEASLESPAFHHCLRWSKRLIWDSDVCLAGVGLAPFVGVGLAVLYTWRVAEGTTLGLATRGQLPDIIISVSSLEILSSILGRRQSGGKM